MDNNFLNHTFSLEQLDFSVVTRNMKIDVDWFRAINHRLLPNHDWHNHSNLEIHFVIIGNLRYNFEDHFIDVTSRNAIIIPSNIVHQLVNTSNEIYYRYILNVAIEPLKQESEALYVKDALNVEKPKMVRLNSNIINLLQSCIDEANNRQNGFVTIIECILPIILIYLARELGQKNTVFYNISEKKSYDLQRVQKIVSYIDQTLSQDIRVQDIAQYAHLSTKQVQRIVKSQYGFCTKQLILSLKHKKAKVLLKNPHISISDVSKMVGYANEQSFSRFFRTMEGQTPSEYREGILPQQQLRDTISLY